jgi:hypothetical protein
MPRLLRFSPNSHLQEILGCGLTDEQFEQISNAFGPLSEIGRKRLFLEVARAVERSRFSHVGRTPSASKQAQHLLSIEDKADELLDLVGPREDARSKDGVSQSSTLPLGLQIAQVLIEKGTRAKVVRRIVRSVPSEGVVAGGIPGEDDRPPIGVTSGAALNLVRIALWVLAEAASRSRAEATAAVSPGRGGAPRRGPTPPTELALELKIYFEIRHRYPFGHLEARGSELKPVTDAYVGELYYGLGKSNDKKD